MREVMLKAVKAHHEEHGNK